MAFIKFTDTTKTYRTQLSIRANGSVALNGGAVLKFGLRNTDYFVLFYDQDKKVIGIKPTHNEEEGSVKVHHSNNGGVWFAARRFLDCFEISREKTTRYSVSWDDNEKMMLVNLFNNQHMQETVKHQR